MCAGSMDFLPDWFIRVKTKADSEPRKNREARNDSEWGVRGAPEWRRDEVECVKRFGMACLIHEHKSEQLM